MSFYLTKASGQKEEFNIQKFKKSLQRAGATPNIVERLAQQIEQMPNLRTTQQIYHYAMQQLHQENPPIAARYNIKQALLELGPTGYPFEQFIARILSHEGFATTTNLILSGKCVTHEIDIIAHKDTTHYMVECKFHNQQGLRSSIKIPLYVQARFEDIMQNPANKNLNKALLVTNTKFSTEAIDYALCVHIDLLGWGYPEENNIAQLIDKYHLQPITTLTNLTHTQKKQLIEQDIVLCTELQKNISILKQLHLSPEQQENILQQLPIQQ